MVKSAQRVIDILELFESECRPLRVADIVERLGLPQSSVSMLLRTLVSRGYMEFDAATRQYCPSVRVAFLGDWTLRSVGQRKVQDTMRWLADETGETVLLGRRSGLAGHPGGCPQQAPPGLRPRSPGWAAPLPRFLPAASRPRRQPCRSPPRPRRSWR